MTDKPFVPERIYVPTKLNGALKGDKFFETPIDGVEYVREDILKEGYAQKKLKTLGSCIVYKATKFEKFLSKYLPKIIPFIGNQKRIKIRNYFKYAYQRRLNKDLCNLLRNSYSSLPEPTKEIKWDDWEWEVIKEQEK